MGACRLQNKKYASWHNNRSAYFYFLEHFRAVRQNKGTGEIVNKSTLGEAK